MQTCGARVWPVITVPPSKGRCHNAELEVLGLVTGGYLDECPRGASTAVSNAFGTGKVAVEDGCASVASAFTFRCNACIQFPCSAGVVQDVFSNSTGPFRPAIPKASSVKPSKLVCPADSSSLIPSEHPEGVLRRIPFSGCAAAKRRLVKYFHSTSNSTSNMTVPPAAPITTPIIIPRESDMGVGSADWVVVDVF